MKKIFRKTAAVLCVMALMPVQNALACTEIYAGFETTEDGKTWFARSEDISPDYPKQFYVSPAGNHKKGESYRGCYSFKWTFTHDSYAYTTFLDDNSSGTCPFCNSDHEHTPYQAAGTNEKGLTVTATETLYPSDRAVDPDSFIHSGINEADIPTILLSEAGTAREALELLTGIYDTIGSKGAEATIISDRNETWYIENMSGTQYIAVKLSDDLLMLETNISIIGKIDLDDKENVYSS